MLLMLLSIALDDLEATGSSGHSWINWVLVFFAIVFPGYDNRYLACDNKSDL